MTEKLTERVCPVVVRQRNDHKWELLAFEHPIAGLQLVKGRIEQWETPEHAVCRELQEESGLVATKEVKFLFATNDLPNTGVWYFFLCEVKDVLLDAWTFSTQDDGGQRFRFFWHPIDDPLTSQWHPLYHHALERLLPRLNAQLTKM